MNKIKLGILLLFLVTLSVFSQEKKYATYEAEKGETVYSISQKFAITPHDLLQLNPDIKDGIAEGQLIIVPNKNYKPELEAEKGDFVKDGFLYHKVLPKENYFRLKKQFGIPKRILRKHNLALRTSDLKAGQIIKIPVKRNFRLPIEIKKEENTTRPYLVKPKETKYSIARRYGISVEQLDALNPHIKDGLKLATIIKVPNTRAIDDPEVNFVMHQIEKGETLFSLSRKFQISQEQLIDNNPDLETEVMEGMLIKIPNELTLENTNAFVPNIPINKQLKVAIMLPFTTKTGSSLDFEKDRTLDIATDFYLGVLMALDSVKKHGLSVSAKVFDTQNRRGEIANILKLNNFEDLDAIVGPMFLDNVKFVSQNLNRDSLVIISPVSSKDHGAFASKNMVQETASDVVLKKKVLEYIKANYENQHLIIIADDDEKNELKIKDIVVKLEAIDSIQKVTVLKPKEGYIKPDLFKESISEDKENWIILVTKDNVVTADVVNNLGVLPENINATLFTVHYGNNFDQIDNNFLARINCHYPTTSFINFEDKGVQKFISNYKAKNFVEPSEYAFKGFDVTYDALLRLATYDDFENAFNGGISERLSSKFKYTKNPSKGFENRGVFLVKYDGLNLKKIE